MTEIRPGKNFQDSNMAGCLIFTARLETDQELFGKKTFVVELWWNCRSGGIVAVVSCGGGGIVVELWWW